MIRSFSASEISRELALSDIPVKVFIFFVFAFDLFESFLETLTGLKSIPPSLSNISNDHYFGIEIE